MGPESRARTQAINALTHFCCAGKVSDWKGHFPCPSDHNDGPVCAPPARLESQNSD